MKTSRIIKITNCLECPYHISRRMGRSVKCLRHARREIIRVLKPEPIPAFVPIPEWCRLEEDRQRRKAAELRAAREHIDRLAEGNSERLKHAETVMERTTAERCRSIAVAQMLAHPGAWGKGATFNAEKIARLIKEEYGLSD